MEMENMKYEEALGRMLKESEESIGRILEEQ